MQEVGIGQPYHKVVKPLTKESFEGCMNFDEGKLAC